jgi:hypothetical protein
LKLSDQAVADEERCSVRKARKLRIKNPVEYNRTILLAQGRQLAEEDKRKAEERKAKRKR